MAANAELKIAESAFRALAKTRWDELKLADVAKAAKMPLASLLREAPNKPALIGPLLQLTVDDALRRYKPERGSSNTRDRIFDVTLSWFEALTPRKAAVQSLYEGLRRDPLTIIVAREKIHAAASTLLSLAEADDRRADLKAAGLALAIVRAIPAWLEDDKHLSKTMASLDGDFGRAEDIAKRFSGERKKTKRAGG